MLEAGKKERLRGLPAVDAVLRGPAGKALAGRHGQTVATAAVREVLDRLRREITAGEDPETSEETVATAASRLLTGRGLRRVVNATGVILHTNLGRSVLSERSPKPPGTTRTWSTIWPPAPAVRATTTRCRSSRS